ncbi:zinc-binding alcohol dehydrogenase family protein [Bosea sp. RCC_152_1]|uniref:zinc-binding alcohol dehydrogenase family protein n=1 Tax=Bosea sp. RCC_152_1 TaxID=3239228 RepID=UPI003525E8BA
MKATAYRKAGPATNPDAFVEIDLPCPEPGPRDLLVRVHAVSVNPVDTKIRASGNPKDGEARILGFDAAGTVEAVGNEVTLFAPGHEVFYAGEVTRPGSNAEFQLVDERLVGHKPRSLNWADAAALPLTSITAWELLFDRLRVPYGVKRKAGTLLVIGGAGGVGSMLIQLACRLTGLTVVATASRAESVDWCRRLGAHHVIDHRQPLSQGLEAVGLRSAEYVASLTASDLHRVEVIKLIAPQGNLAITDAPSSYDVVPLLKKAVTIAGEAMFVRSIFKTPDMIEQHRLLNEVAELVDAGLLRTTAMQNMGLMRPESLAKAHAAVESGTTIGKITLRVSELG